MKLYTCDCEYQELQNRAEGTVKGYVLISECFAHKSQRDKDNIERSRSY